MFKNIFSGRKRFIYPIIGLVIFSLIPLFVHSPYYLDLFIMMIINAVLGMMFIMGLRVGLINMGIIAFWGIGAYASAILSTKYNVNVWLCLPMSALITAIFALALGAILMRSQSSGLAFVMLSIVIGMVFNVAIGSLSFLGGWNGIPNIPPPNPIKLPFLAPLEFTSKVPFFYLGLFIFVIIVLISYAFYASSIGRAWRAIGMSPRLAESTGVDLFKYKLLAFVLSASLCGLIGAFYAHYQAYILPDYFSMWQNIYVQIYVILGGPAFAFLGPIVGAAVMTFFPEFIRNAREFAPVFTGAMLVLLIMFLPEGLLGLGKYRGDVTRGIAKLSSFMERKARRA
jgi:branched-chain amino acid transport system permease protein